METGWRSNSCSPCRYCKRIREWKWGRRRNERKDKNTDAKSRGRGRSGVRSLLRECPRTSNAAADASASSHAGLGTADAAAADTQTRPAEKHHRLQRQKFRSRVLGHDQGGEKYGSYAR